MCVQWCEDDGPPQIALPDREMGERFRDWVEDPGTLIVGYYAEVDLAICARTFGLEKEVERAYMAGRISCGALREKLIDLARPGEMRWSNDPRYRDPEDPEEKGAKGYCYVYRVRENRLAGRQERYRVAKSKYGMQAVWGRRFGEDLSAEKGEEAWRKRYGELIGVPLEEWPEEALRYALEDAERTRRIWREQTKRPRGKGEWLSAGWWENLGAGKGALLKAEEARVYYSYGLQRLRDRGFKVDRERAGVEVAAYRRLEDIGRSYLKEKTERQWPSGRRRRSWKPIVRVERGREIMTRDRLQSAVVRAYFDHPHIPPDLTDKGMEEWAELEGEPIDRWPREALKYVSAAGKSLGGVVGARTEDAKLLAKAPEEARAWPEERVRAALAGCDYPPLLASVVASKAKSFLAMLEPLVEADYACPRFNSLLETGRISLLGLIRQNMPRSGGVRECFVPRPGHRLIVADYSQIELIAASYVFDRAHEIVNGLPAHSFQGTLTKTLNAGLDGHLLLSLGILPDDVRAKVTYQGAVDAGLLSAEESGRECIAAIYEDAAHPLHKLVKKCRQDSKATNFGLPGGMGAKQFARTQTNAGSPLTVEEAQRQSDAWFAWWEPWAYFQFVRDVLKRCSPLAAGIDVPGSGMVVGGRRYCQLANIGFQGLAAEGFRRAFLAFQRECLFAEPGDALYGCAALLAIHDEIVGEAPAEGAKRAQMRMSEIMVREMESVLPGMRVVAEGLVLDRWRKC